MTKGDLLPQNTLDSFSIISRHAWDRNNGKGHWNRTLE